MNEALKQHFDRIISARERLLALRAERVNVIVSLQSYLRARFDEFFTNVDPISGSRLADLGVDGSKGAGEMSLIFAMFDGSRMRIAVDAFGQFSYEADPNVFEDIAELIGFEVSPDFAQATVEYVPAGSPTGRPVRVGFDVFVDRLVRNTVDVIEAQANPAPPVGRVPDIHIAPAPAAYAPEPMPAAPAASAPSLHAVPPPVPEYDLPRIARAPIAPEPAPRYDHSTPAYRYEEQAPAYRENPAVEPAYRSELPRLEAERAPDPIRYSEKVRPLERPRPVEPEPEFERAASYGTIPPNGSMSAPMSGGPVSEIPLKPRLSFSVR